MTDEQMLNLMKGVVNDAKAETLTRTGEMILASETRTAERIDEKTYAMETKLLKEFRKWAVRIEARGKVAETSLVS